MALRYRKSIKIAPGVKLNLNKKSVGVSVGVKGARVAVNTSGRKTTTVGVPGTGVSYVKTSNIKSKNTNAKSASNNVQTASQQSIVTDTKANPKNKKIYLVLIVVSILIIFIGLFSVPSSALGGVITMVIGAIILAGAAKKFNQNDYMTDTSHKVDETIDE